MEVQNGKKMHPPSKKMLHTGREDRLMKKEKKEEEEMGEKDPDIFAG